MKGTAKRMALSEDFIARYLSSAFASLLKAGKKILHGPPLPGNLVDNLSAGIDDKRTHGVVHPQRLVLLAQNPKLAGQVIDDRLVGGSKPETALL